MQVWREWTNLPDGAWLWAVRWQFERRNKDSFPFLLHRIAHFISYSPSFYFLLSPSIFFLSITLSFNYYSLTLFLDPIMMMVYLLVTQHMSSQNRIFIFSGFYFLLSLSIFFYQPHHPLIIIIPILRLVQDPTMVMVYLLVTQHMW